MWQALSRRRQRQHFHGLGNRRHVMKSVATTMAGAIVKGEVARIVTAIMIRIQMDTGYLKRRSIQNDNIDELDRH
jgi:hypothetical protein